MAKPFVFVTRKIPQAGLDYLKDKVEMEIWEDELPPPRVVLLDKVKNTDGLICLLTDKVNAELLDHAPKLKVVSNMAVGFDNIDVPEITRRKIPGGNTPGVLTDTTADLAWALMLAAARRISEGERYVHAQKWRTWGPLLFLGVDVHHATLGIVGMGRIGQAVARRAKGFDMKIIYYDTERKPDAEKDLGVEAVDFDGLLHNSDFISIHTILGESTKNMFSEKEFKKMKSNAIIVNTARGPIINPKDLYKALKEGTIRAAALDVTEPEPIPNDDPLLTLENCVIVPHVGSASLATRSKMSLMAAENLLAGIKGERLPNCINPQVYKE